MPIELKRIANCWAWAFSVPRSSETAIDPAVPPALRDETSVLTALLLSMASLCLGGGRKASGRPHDKRHVIAKRARNPGRPAAVPQLKGGHLMRLFVRIFLVVAAALLAL